MMIRDFLESLAPVIGEASFLPPILESAHAFAMECGHRYVADYHGLVGAMRVLPDNNAVSIVAQSVSCRQIIHSLSELVLNEDPGGVEPQPAPSLWQLICASISDATILRQQFAIHHLIAWFLSRPQSIAYQTIGKSGETSPQRLLQQLIEVCHGTMASAAEYYYLGLHDLLAGMPGWGNSQSLGGQG